MNMKEQRNIIQAFREIKKDRPSALATVVRVHGSSYRSPGARMLITDDGHWYGSISGGCLEGDALRKARLVMSSQRAVTVTYDTREESNQNLGIGLGCNGVIDVLLEPVNEKNPSNPITVFEKIIQANHLVALATVITGNCIGEKVVTSEAGDSEGTISNSALMSLVCHDLHDIFKIRKSQVKKYTVATEEVEVFLELIQPSVSLLIFGGGFDARPVSVLAKSLGWEVAVTDECVAHIAPVFFPSADKLSLCQREFIDRDFTITPFTACVLMSHNYEYDRDVLKKLLNSPAPYIGILGPRKRFEKMQGEFTAQGIVLTELDLHRIHSPIGLDIGAETPDEIAVSIIAEIQSKFANRSGGFLKYNTSPIHQRDQKTGQVFKQVYLNVESTTKQMGN